MVAKTAGRSTRRYKLLKKQFRAQCAERNAPCHLCGQEIDYSLEFPHKSAWTLDHLYAVSTHPHLAEDPGNFRASHFDCNFTRGADKVQADKGQPTEDW